MPTFEYSSRLPAPVERVFAFHERPDALDLLAPPGKKMCVVRRQGGLEAGAEVEFRIPAGPFSIRWLALHTEYEPNRLFTDVQRKGPFRYWRHRHRFEPEGGGARLTDSIEFSLPGGPPVDALLGWLVKWRLRTYFRHRHQVTRRQVCGAEVAHCG